MDLYQIQTIKLTCAAASEAVAKALMDSKGEAIVDRVDRILKALGFK